MPMMSQLQFWQRVALATACFLAASLGTSSGETPVQCHCSNATLCRHINATDRPEVLAFVNAANKAVWSQFDWTKLTTVVLHNFYDGDLFCHAHEHNVTVSFTAPVTRIILRNSTQRRNWIKKQVTYAKSHYLDGINIMSGAPLRRSATELRALSLLVNETANALRAAIPRSQVTFNVPWSPIGVDGRHFDARSIARSCDFLLVTGFDEQGCTMQRLCAARPNAGFFKTVRGIKGYLDLGIPSRKLVLGVPWFGYDYPCRSLKKNDTMCLIDRIPFLGCPCNNRVAVMRTHGAIQDMLLNNRTTTGRLWNNDTLSPFFNYNSPRDGRTHQIQYDDASSLTYKYSYALGAKLRGVGVWLANYLNYSRPEEVAEMWGALPSPLADFADARKLSNNTHIQNLTMTARMRQ